MVMMSSMSCYVVVGLSQQQPPPPPKQWIEKYNKGHLFFSTRDWSPALNATIGNGYFATNVYSDTLYMSGVYNGYNNTTPSHRARLQGFSALTWSIIDPSWALVGYALDLEHAIYWTQYASRVGNCTVQQGTYAHRTRRNVAVVELQMLGTECGGQPLTMVSHINMGEGSLDMSPPMLSRQTDLFVQYEFHTLLPERVGVTYVSVAQTRVAPNVTLVPGGQPLVWLFSFASSFANQSSASSEAWAALESAYNTSVHQLRQEHVDAWNALSVTDRIGVTSVTPTNLALVQTTVSSLYYLLSSVRSDWDFSLSPGGLASQGYNGHVFWDAESWMYPSLLLFYPDIAASMLRYRRNTLQGAFAKARSYDPPYKGACMAWESAQTGIETCPASCVGCGSCTREIHINGDVALALASYYWMQKDDAWLASVAFPIVSAMSDFWASRVTSNPGSSYSINDVVPPDEYSDHVRDSAFTNVGASFTLNVTIAWAKTLGITTPSIYSDIARGLRVPFNDTLGIILEFDGYQGATIKQADVILLGYPMPTPLLTPEVRARNVAYYTPRTDKNGPAMTWGATSIALLEQGPGQLQLANAFFLQSYSQYVHPPWGIWWETIQGGASNFLTGAGGFLQGIPFGYAGIRITEEGLVFLNIPVVPAEAVDDGFYLRGIAYAGNALDAQFTQTTMTLTSNGKGEPLKVFHGNKVFPLSGVLKISRDSQRVVVVAS